MEHDFKFRGLYKIPELSSIDEWKQHVSTLDSSLETPELFGIHRNGDISSAKMMANNLMETALMTLPRSAGSSAESEEKEMETLCNQLLKDLPEEFSMDDVNRLKPVVRDNSLNTVITQDVLR